MPAVVGAGWFGSGVNGKPDIELDSGLGMLSPRISRGTLMPSAFWNSFTPAPAVCDVPGANPEDVVPAFALLVLDPADSLAAAVVLEATSFAADELVVSGATTVFSPAGVLEAPASEVAEALSPLLDVAEVCSLAGACAPGDGEADAELASPSATLVDALSAALVVDASLPAGA